MKNLLVFLLMPGLCLAQQMELDLVNKLKNKDVIAVNRTITVSADASHIEMDAKEGDGLGIIEGVSFVEGDIELDIKGANIKGRSFVGFAFNIQNDSTYEAIYFRPFNFVAEEEIRQLHMLQYIKHPEFTWHALRESRTGEFENRIQDPPDPNDWFHARIVIEANQITVYVNEADEPSLQVERLDSFKSDRIGVWTGFNSAGAFGNLKIK